MAGTHVSGTVLSGAPSLTITNPDATAITGLILEEYSLTADSTVVDPKNASGVPTANLLLIENRDKVSIRLQLGSTAVVRGATFSRNNIAYIVDSVGTVEPRDSYHIQNITALRTTTQA